VSKAIAAFFVAVVIFIIKSFNSIQEIRNGYTQLKIKGIAI
jgi:hypothetical protein